MSGQYAGNGPGRWPALDDPLVEIVLPVYNEERVLGDSVTTLASYLARRFPFRWAILIADNASTDGTPAIARELAVAVPAVRSLRIEQKGRGRALETAWSASGAGVLAYMDVDLSTRLEALTPLVRPLVQGEAAIVIGSRLLPQSRVTRGWKREVLSRGYNALIRAGFRPGFHDAQCGFKAMRADARPLLSLVQDTGWFFDTELLLLAHRNALPVAEVPVTWVDDPDSRVHVRSTVVADLKGLWRMRRAFWAGGGRLPQGALPTTGGPPMGRLDGFDVAAGSR